MVARLHLTCGNYSKITIMLRTCILRFSMAWNNTELNGAHGCFLCNIVGDPSHSIFKLFISNLEINVIK